jgi:hypothetical protein
LGNTPVTVDLLPYTGLGPGQGSYDFQVIYNGRTSATWRQDIAVDPLIVFRTTKVTSTYVGNAYYYNGGWQLFSSPSELMGGTENISPYGTKTADFKFGGTSGTYPTYTFYITGCDLTVGPPLFTITATAGDDGSVTPAEVTSVNSGGSQTYTITPNTGYHVADVLVDNSSVGAVTSYPFTNVTTNHTISASFEIDTYQLTVSSTTGGLISAPSSSPVTVDYGVATTITAAASPGYTFSGWTVVHQLPLHQT